MENINSKKCANCGNEMDLYAQACSNCGSTQFFPITYAGAGNANFGNGGVSGNDGFGGNAYQQNYQQQNYQQQGYQQQGYQQQGYNGQGEFAGQFAQGSNAQDNYNGQGEFAGQQTYQNVQADPNFMNGGNNGGEPPKKKLNTPAIIAIIAAALIVLGIAGYFIFTALSNKDDDDDKDSKKDESYSESEDEDDKSSKDSKKSKDKKDSKKDSSKDSNKDSSKNSGSSGKYTEKDLVGAWGAKMKWTELMKLAGEAGEDTSNELLNVFNGLNISVEMVFNKDNTVELLMSKKSVLDMWDKVVDFYCSEEGVYYIYTEQGYSEDEIDDMINEAGGVDVIIDVLKDEFGKYSEDEIMEQILNRSDEIDGSKYNEWVSVTEAQDYSVKGSTIVLGDGSVSTFKFSNGNKTLEITDDVTLKLNKTQLPQ